MYKFLKNFIIVVLIFFVVSCSEDFLEVDNKNQLTDESFYQTQEDFYMALNSLYSPLAHGGLFGYGHNFLFGSFEDRILFETPGMDMITVNPATTGLISEMWRDTYMGVYRTNMFVKMLNERQNIEGMDADMRKSYMGQAKALRAAFMFYLVVIYDRPPFYDELTMPTDLNIPATNGNPEQFWNLIKEDLIFASQNLPPSHNDDNLGRITSGAALSMLGKAMLYKNYYYYARNNQKGSAENLADLRIGRDALKEVIDSERYRLIMPMAPKTREDYLYALLSNSSYVDLPAGNNLYKSENNDESIWEIQYSDDRQGQGWLPGWMWSGARNFEYYGPTNYRNHEGHPDLWDEFETEGAPEGFDRDPRAYATFYLQGDRIDFRAESPNVNATWRANINSKRVALNRSLIPSPNPYPTTSFGIKKYYFPVYYERSAPLNDPINRRKIRFADVLLMYAETTLLLQENVSDGLAALNRVRARVDMPEIASLTRAAIIHERDIELAFEGLRWFDLIRWSFDPEWNINMQQLLSRQTGPDGTGTFFQAGKHEFMPFPIREIDLGNGQLKQNPGW